MRKFFPYSGITISIWSHFTCEVVNTQIIGQEDIRYLVYMVFLVVQCLLNHWDVRTWQIITENEETLFTVLVSNTVLQSKRVTLVYRMQLTTAHVVDGLENSEKDTDAVKIKQDC